MIGLGLSILQRKASSTIYMLLTDTENEVVRTDEPNLSKGGHKVSPAERPNASKARPPED